MIPERAELDCPNCSYFDREMEMCLHPDGAYSDECVWTEED